MAIAGSIEQARSGGLGRWRPVLSAWLRRMIRPRRQPDRIASREALLLTLQNVSQGIAMVDASGRTAVVNRRALELLDADGPEAIDPAWLLVPPIDAPVRLAVREVARADGAIIEICSQTLPDGGAVFTYTDITGHKRTEASIAELALRDMLTGLANRRQLHQDIDNAIGLCTRFCDQFAVLQLNIDDFKTVNDVFGHDHADRLLQAVGERLVALAGPHDVVARPAGDEFAIVRLEPADPDDAERLARRIQASFAKPILLGGRSALLSLSIGIARFPLDGHDAKALLRSAGIALSAARAAGPGHCRVFEPEMETALRQRRVLQDDLREALSRGRIGIAFQPQFHAQTLQIVGFEALARWEHPRLGAIQPTQFIGIAEESGLIDQLGEQMLRLACAHASAWPQPLRVGVNLSPLQFRDPDLPERVMEVVQQTGLAPQRLEIEVTEGVLIREARQARSTVAAFRAQGIGVALDDFGTGYSSLSYLRHFPFSTIKIDRSFVRSLESEEPARAILEAIMTMAHRLALGVIAEGVETAAQMHILQKERCTELQGFLLGRPLAPDRVADFIAVHSQPKAG